MSAAITAAQVWPGRRILLIRPEEEPVVPCGIPYIFGTLKGVEHDLLSSAPIRTLGGEILCGRVTEVDLQKKTAGTESGIRVHWQRLVLATGTVPHLPPIPGIRRPGVFVIRKDYDHLEHLFEDLIPGVKRLAVVGGGFISVEFADEVRKSGVAVTVIEQLPHILLRNFDQEVSVRIEQELRARDVSVHTGSGVTAMEGEGDDGPVRTVHLANGERTPAEAVLVAIGDRRNTVLGERHWASGWPVAAGSGWMRSSGRARIPTCSQWGTAPSSRIACYTVLCPPCWPQPRPRKAARPA
jgi:NADH oxidase (H2O2-forming)